MGTGIDSECPKSFRALTARAQVKPRQSVLPRGLIGAKCTAQVNVAGVMCDYLLDTGSQVTAITKSFYNENLYSQPIHSLNDLLEVEGADGQNVPYLGYVELTITFPKDFVGVDTEVLTLALIVPDLPSTSQPSVLIGTNTLDNLYKDFSQQKTFLPLMDTSKCLRFWRCA